MKKMKRYFALLLCLCMAVTILTPAATAAEGEESVRILDTQVHEEQTALQEEEAPSEQEIPAEGETIKIGADAFLSDLRAPGETAQPMAGNMTWSDLQTALKGGGTVKLTNDVIAGSNDTYLSVPSGVTVTLDLNGYTMDRHLTAELKSDGYVIQVGGDLTLTDSSATDEEKTDGTGKITGGNNTNNRGGGVYVYGGSFTMEGGSICGNRTTVGVDNGGGGGVCSSGTFIMKGGRISGNTATYSSGGGVYVKDSGSFTMVGGIISDNSACYSGGGVYLDSGGFKSSSFLMIGGRIENNSAMSGAGVSVSTRQNVPCTFTMRDGSITGNNATTGGGGVSSGGEFYMHGGVIEGNSAGRGGGVQSGGEFHMDGGSIVENIASNIYDGCGGGVSTAGSFTMNGGSIIGNTSEGNEYSYGGGVYVSGGTFTMLDGGIEGNTSEGNGGGVCVSTSSILELQGDWAEHVGPDITGNVKGGTITDGVLAGGTTQNVHLANGARIKLRYSRESTAQIGVTTEMSPAVGAPITLTDGLTARGCIGVFFSDNEDYVISWDETGEEAALYMPGAITIADSENGTVAADLIKAIPGETITLTLTPDSGFKLNTLTVLNGEEEVELTQADESTYTFVMPAADVTVQANFVSTQTPLVIVTQPEDCEVDSIGDTATFTVVAEGEGLSYVWWYKNPSSTTFTRSVIKKATYSTPVTATSNGRELYCVITDKYGNSVQTDTVTMSARESLKIVTQPVDCVVDCIGDTATFTVVAEGEGLSYIWWYRNPSSTAFTKSVIKKATYSTPVTATSNGRELYCVVTDKYGNSVQTNTVTMTALNTQAGPKIVKQPVDCVVDAIGNTATFTVIAEGEGLSYIWWYKNPSSNTFTKSVIKKATYSTPVTATSNGRELYCVVTDKYGNSVQTDTVTMSARESLKIVKQPVDCVVDTIGNTATFTVVAEGEGLSYIWWYKNPSSTTFTKSVIKKATYSTPVTATSNGRELYCVVTDKYGNSVQTDTVTMSARESLKIVTQPVDCMFNAIGDTATFTVVAEGEGLSFVWWYKNPSSTTFTKSVIKKATYSTPVTATSNGRELYCVVTDKYGNSVQTDTVFMRVREPIRILRQPEDCYVEKLGDRASFTVEAEGEGLSYQWFITANRHSTNTAVINSVTTTTSTYTPTVTASNNGSYVYCVITDKKGNTVETRRAVMAWETKDHDPYDPDPEEDEYWP